MTLADIYGAPLAQAIRGAFIAPGGSVLTFEEAPAGNGVRLYARWSLQGKVVGTAKVDCSPGRMHFASLTLDPRIQRDGVTTALVGALCDAAEAAGVRAITLAARDAASAGVFRLTGAEDAGDGLAYDTAGQRRKGYAAWKRGEAPEPAWHVAMGVSGA